MQLIVNHQNMTPNLLDISSVRIEGQLSDPVSKAYFQLDDTGPQIPLVAGQEVIICDETIQLTRVSQINAVSAPVVDTFADLDSSLYTSTFNPTGGSAATWTWSA